MSVGGTARSLRVALLSAMTVVLAPFVLVSIIIFRKVSLRVHHKARFWNKRLRHEYARWT